MRSSFPTAAMALAASLALGASATAGGVDPYGFRQPHPVTVTYADRELSAPDGAKALARRLRAAAFDACGGEDDPLVAYSADLARCEREALARATDALDAPMLARALGRAPRNFAVSHR